MTGSPAPIMTGPAVPQGPAAPGRGQVRYAERLALVDLLDRVLAGGVVVAGDITLSIAGVDLVRISLRALVASVAAMAESVADAAEPGP